MRLRSLAMPALVTLGLVIAFTSVSAGPDNAEFWKVWKDRKATNLEKNDAVNGLAGGKELTDEYLEILESDVWQYRASITGRVKDETNKELLAELEKFLFDEKEVSKKPAAGEHLVWALYNNKNWVNAEKWARASQLVTSKKTPDKVKARMLRELGVFRGAPDNAEIQAQAKENVKTLVSLLEWAASDKKFSRELKFLISDALESLSSQDFGDDLDKWRFFANNLKDTEPLKPRRADAFKDQFTDVELEGHSFSRPTPRPVEMEVLILPNLYTSDLYWYPYIFEINKTFKCTFVKLPDCSKMKDLEWLKNRDGTINRAGYYYPLTQLVEAFEERRAQSKQKKIGLVAHGISGWVALEYLRLHPESVAFAVIISTWSGRTSFLEGCNALQNTKDDAFKWYAESLKYDESGRTGQTSMNKEQLFWASTGDYKRRWADPKALEPIFYSLDPWKVKPEGSARIFVPERYEFESQRKIDVPTLFIHGAKDPSFISKDQSDYKKGFTNMTWAVFENSSQTPWAEEPIRFFSEWETLLEKNKIIEKLKEEAAKEAEKGN
ncbi:MAG: alpha/beta hydrolase [Planctomycetes bacterium]|nr:alpha/beta hydrolase [Planctomycetota bacterium]MCB9934792.1 alpha/beta hydrolase [Planctomycetota bacterium]